MVELATTEAQVLWTASGGWRRIECKSTFNVRQSFTVATRRKLYKNTQQPYCNVTQISNCIYS